MRSNGAVLIAPTRTTQSLLIFFRVYRISIGFPLISFDFACILENLIESSVVRVGAMSTAPLDLIFGTVRLWYIIYRSIRRFFRIRKQNLILDEKNEKTKKNFFFSSKLQSEEFLHFSRFFSPIFF